MALLKTNRHCMKLLPTGCRILSCCFSSLITEQPPYWHKIFPDKRIRNFDEMPTVGPVIEEYKNFKIHESYQRWVKDVGHIVKELFPDGSCCVHIYHKDDFKTVYQNDGGRPLRKSHGVIAKYRQDRPLIYGNVGLGPGLGDEWARMRKMLPSGVAGKEYLPFRYELEGITNFFIELIRMKMDKNGEVELLPLLFRWAFESIGFVALNRYFGSLFGDGDEEVNKLIEAAHLTNEIIFLSNVCDFEKQYERLVPIQDYFASKVIEYVEETINLNIYGPCIVTNLMEAGFDVKLISTLIMDLFQGATATVPLTLTWALYHLSRCPDIQERARQELIEKMPTKRSKYYKTIEGTKRGELLLNPGEASLHVQAILRETLRLIPPIIGNGRVSQRDLVLGGYMVPAGTMIVLQFQAACMLEEYFERPLEFLPDRFINRNKYHQVGGVSLPFGFGARFCIGQQFAQGQLILALSKILRNFEVSYDREEVGVINRLHNEPDRPVIFKLKPLKQ